MGRMKAADAALKLDWDTVVPGHGPISNRSTFTKWRADSDAIRNRMAAMLRDGKTKDDVVKMLVSDFGWDPMGRATTNSIDGMMAEVRKQSQ